MEGQGKMLVVAITGPTASGKTTLAQALVERLTPLTRVKLISQDNFYLPDAVLEDIGEFKNWDVPSAIDFVAMEKEIEATLSDMRKTMSPAVVVVEGLLLLSAPALHSYFNAQIILEVSLETFKDRRFKRDDWLRENPSYFDLAVLPAHHLHGKAPHLEHCQRLSVNAEMPLDEMHALIFESIDDWRISKV